MRPGFACVLVCGLSAGAAFAAGSAPPQAPLTIVLKFDGPYSTKSIEEMKLEFARAVKNSMAVEWRMRDELPATSVGDLVLFTFKGRCVMDTVPPPIYDETGPLAWTSTADHTPLPFGQVSCDQVRNVVLKAMWGADFSHGDMLFGRALGRVVAHEVYHMVAKTTGHGASGVTRPALTGAQLISGSLTVDDDSLDRMEHDRQ